MYCKYTKVKSITLTTDTRHFIFRFHKRRDFNLSNYASNLSFNKLKNCNFVVRGFQKQVFF